MSLSAELKDFAHGFKSGVDMYTKMQDSKSLRDYRQSRIDQDTLPPGFGQNVGGATSGGNDLDKLMNNIGQRESGNRYNAVGPKTKDGHYAYGKYQVKDTNIPVWTKEILGRALTPQEFLENGDAQEKVARAKLGEYMKTYGNAGDVASMWFAGKPLSQVAQNASDGYTTVGSYVGDVTKGISAPTGTAQGQGGASVGTAAAPGTAPAEAETPRALAGAPLPQARPKNLAGDIYAPDDDEENRVAMAGYAEGGKVEKDDFVGSPGLNTKFDPTFRKSLLDLQRRATAAGIKTHLISGVRTIDDQKELYANFLAGKAGKPLPFPKRGAVALAAKPGTSPHEKGMAADLAVDDPRDRARLVELSKTDPNLRHIENDPNHFELNTKGGAPDTAVASGKAMPPAPADPGEEEDDPIAESQTGEAAEEGGRGDSNAQAMADATERGRANQQNAAYAAQGNQAKLMQESQLNEQALGQEAVARAQPPQQVEAAAAGGPIGAVPTGYVPPQAAGNHDLVTASTALAAAQGPPVNPGAVSTGAGQLAPILQQGDGTDSGGRGAQLATLPGSVIGYADPISGRPLPLAAGQMPQGMDAETQGRMIGPAGMAHLKQAGIAPAPVGTAAATGTARGYAAGGEVDEAVPTDQPSTSAQPAQVPAQPPPQPPPNLVADGLHAGIDALTRMFGLSRTGAVQDPDAQARIQAFNNGAGAADGEAMHAVHRAVDPQRQMTPQQLSTASIAALQKFYEGDPVRGGKAIAEVMQHQKAVSAHYASQAASAFQQGDVVNGVKLLTAAYDQVPDGQHIEAQPQPDGTVSFRLTDSHTGQVVHQGVANAQQLAQLARIGATGSPYVQAVTHSATRGRTPTMPPSNQLAMGATDTMTDASSGPSPEATAATTGQPLAGGLGSGPAVNPGADLTSGVSRTAPAPAQAAPAPEPAVDTGEQPRPVVTPTPSIHIAPEAPVAPAVETDVPPLQTAAPQSVEGRYDLTPREFTQPPPDPDQYFGRYNQLTAQYPNGNRAVRRALTAEYAKAKNDYTEAQTAWNQQRELFGQTEARRIAAENEKAGRAQGIENVVAGQRFQIGQEQTKLAEQKNAQQREFAHQNQAAVDSRNAAIRMKELDINNGNAKDDRQLQATIDSQMRGFAQQDKDHATINPPDRATKNDINAALTSTEGGTPFPTMLAEMKDPKTGEPFGSFEAAKKSLGAGTVTGMKELAGHIMHANGMDADTATEIVKQMTDVSMDDVANVPFEVRGKDKAGNSLLYVPNFGVFKVSDQMMKSIPDLRKRMTGFRKEQSKGDQDRAAEAAKPGVFGNFFGRAGPAVGSMVEKSIPDTHTPSFTPSPQLKTLKDWLSVQSPAPPPALKGSAVDVTTSPGL